MQWARTAFGYAGTGGRLVRGLKFQHNLAAGRFLVAAMARHVRSTAPRHLREHVIVPIPIHPLRLRRRGFDQAVWLAIRLAQRLGLPAEPRLLRRDRPTLPQGDPRVVSRLRNVAGAFSVRSPVRLPGRRVLLVDDVATSGATAAECARVLRRAGARSVALVTACRGRIDRAWRAE